MKALSFQNRSAKVYKKPLFTTQWPQQMQTDKKQNHV